MERGVPDTSVIISALLFERSVPAQALFRLSRKNKPLASRETLEELLETLLQPKFDRWLPLHERLRFFAQFESLAEIIMVQEVVRACRDPKDDKFLSLAVSGSADLILTGDKDLLSLHPFRGIPILSPQQYLATIA